MGTPTNFIEKLVARKMIASLLAQGFSLTVNDGEMIMLLRSTDAAAIEAAMFSTDEDYIYVHRDDANSGPYDVFLDADNYDESISADLELDGNENVIQPRDFAGHIYMVYGNDGWDVISDYSTGLTDALKDTDDFCTRIENGDATGITVA